MMTGERIDRVLRAGTCIGALLKCLPRSRLAPSATGVGRDRVTLELTGCGDLPWVTFPRPQESREDRRCDVQVARPLGEDTQGSEARNTPSRLVAPSVS